jgi:hypothetical protein
MLYSTPVTLPLPLRNRLAELILDAFHDPGARAGLEALAAICADPRARNGGRALPQRFPTDLFEARGGEMQIRSGYRAHAGELGDRVRRGWDLVRQEPFAPEEAPLDQVLRTSARLFDAGLYFEVHEHLEPYWIRAEGGEREVLQGLIQTAVAFQHLANGNVKGARLLLRDGIAKLAGRRLPGLALDGFTAALRRCAERVDALGTSGTEGFDWAGVPRFPLKD